MYDVPLAVKTRTWYMHSGAPTHFSHAVPDILSHTCHDRWIGRGGPTAWSPSSPDFSPLDFYMWGHLNAFVYAATVDNEEALHYRIVDPCQIIHVPRGALNMMEKILSTFIHVFFLL
jgi:hypothetical protein